MFGRNPLKSGQGFNGDAMLKSTLAVQIAIPLNRVKVSIQELFKDKTLSDMSQSP